MKFRWGFVGIVFSIFFYKSFNCSENTRGVVFFLDDVEGLFWAIDIFRNPFLSREKSDCLNKIPKK